MKVYECISTEEIDLLHWGEFFTKGEFYTGEVNENGLLLTDDKGHNMYVDPEQFELAMDTDWKKYKRVGYTEMRPYIVGEDMSEISVAEDDQPELDMGMIARDPNNHSDQWYVNREYFESNLEEI